VPWESILTLLAKRPYNGKGEEASRHWGGSSAWEGETLLEKKRDDPCLPRTNRKATAAETKAQLSCGDELPKRRWSAHGEIDGGEEGERAPLSLGKVTGDGENWIIRWGRMKKYGGGEKDERRAKEERCRCALPGGKLGRNRRNLGRKTTRIIRAGREKDVGSYMLKEGARGLRRAKKKKGREFSATENGSSAERSKERPWS